MCFIILSKPRLIKAANCPSIIVTTKKSVCSPTWYTQVSPSCVNHQLLINTLDVYTFFKNKMKKKKHKNDYSPVLLHPRPIPILPSSLHFLVKDRLVGKQPPFLQCKSYSGSEIGVDQHKYISRFSHRLRRGLIG